MSGAALILPPLQRLPVPDQHAPTVYLAQLSPLSQRTMSSSLKTLAGLLSGGQLSPGEIPWHELRYQHVSALQAQLKAQKKAPATICRHMAALRGVLRQAWLLGQMPHEEYARALQVKQARGERLPPGRILPYSELHALLRVCQEDQRPIGVRDAAMITVLYDGLLRRHELVKLTMDGYDRGTRTLRFIGKHNKERSVCLSAGAVQPLECWLKVRGQEAGSIFWPVTKGGLLVNRQMSADAVRLMLRHRAIQAGIRPCTPHDIRRTGISDMLDIPTVDALAVSGQAGHDSPSTTLKYDRRAERAKMKAAEGLHIPWQWPAWVDGWLKERGR